MKQFGKEWFDMKSDSVLVHDPDANPMSAILGYSIGGPTTHQKLCCNPLRFHSSGTAKVAGSCPTLYFNKSILLCIYKSLSYEDRNESEHFKISTQSAQKDTEETYLQNMWAHLVETGSFITSRLEKINKVLKLLISNNVSLV